MSLRRNQYHRRPVIDRIASRAHERAATQWLREILAEEQHAAGVSWDDRVLGASRSPRGGGRQTPRRRRIAPVVVGLSLFGVASSIMMPSRGDASDAGQVVLAAGDRGTQAIVVGAGGLWPGKEVERAITLSNASATPFLTIALTVSAATSSALDTDPVDGLQLRVDRCSAPWATVGPRDDQTYLCHGTISTALAQQPVIGTDRALAGVAARRPEGADHLRLVLGLPVTAGNEFQGQSSRLRFTFTGAGRPPQRLPQEHGR